MRVDKREPRSEFSQLNSGIHELPEKFGVKFPNSTFLLGIIYTFTELALACMSTFM